jgi:hypothetical protein
MKLGLSYISGPEKGAAPFLLHFPVTLVATFDEARLQEIKRTHTYILRHTIYRPYILDLCIVGVLYRWQSFVISIQKHNN